MMRRRTRLLLPAAACAVLSALCAAGSAQVTEICNPDNTPTNANTPPEVRLADDSRLGAGSPSPQGKLPVLFVHGHNGDSSVDSDCNYQKDRQDSPGAARTSFKQTLALAQKATLGVEPYYIRFHERTRSRQHQ